MPLDLLLHRFANLGDIDSEESRRDGGPQRGIGRYIPGLVILSVPLIIALQPRMELSA